MADVDSVMVAAGRYAIAVADASLDPALNSKREHVELRREVERAVLDAVIVEHIGWCRICLGGYDCDRLRDLRQQRAALDAPEAAQRA